MGDFLGSIRLAAPIQAYPLGYHRAARIISDRLALVGDAAHAIHPIAGQGVNLGYRDVAALTEVLVEGMRSGLEPGDAQLLARYQRWRALDSMSVTLMMDGLVRLFDVPGRPASRLRRMGLGAVQRLGPLKDRFMAEARGESGPRPRLAAWRDRLIEFGALGVETYVWLVCAAMLAGFIDSIAGGGGLITVPALLAAGLPPVQCAGHQQASVRPERRNGLLALWAERSHRFPGAYRKLPALVFLCGFTGAWTVQRTPNDMLVKIMPALIICVIAYMIFSPRMSDIDSHERLSNAGYAPVGGAIGFYDGFFGPGAGSFYTTSLVALRGMGLRRAVAHTKLFNAASNAASGLLFAFSGEIVWTLGLMMAVGSIMGAWIGSHFAMRHGAAIIRPLLVLVSLTLSLKLLWDNFS